MKLSIIVIVLSAALFGSTMGVSAQLVDTNEAPFIDLIAQVNADLKAGKHTEADLAADLHQFDALVAAQKSQHPGFAVKILVQQAVLYEEVLNEPEKAKGIFLEIKTNYAGLVADANLDGAIKQLDLKIHLKAIRASQVPGTHLPDFVTDLAGNPLSTAQYQGKVLLIDFWATWCMPCRIEMPHVIAAYEKYHAEGFEIIGVTLDDDQTQVERFLRDSKMPWPEYCEGKGWDNSLTGKYGIDSIPSNILLDTKGNIIGRDLKGDDLMQAVAKALGK